MPKVGGGREADFGSPETVRRLPKLDLGAFEGHSDQWILMIFGCTILHYFTMFFNDVGVLRWSERVECRSSRGF